ncbi:MULTISPECIES: hypothetical protein [Rhizobium]|uniref:Uncharacterized protein n=1 Tax=Rhizobium favelukesii TaxID=348824 RepID=W6RGY3_9HYPH|nr:MULTISPECIES: hypothetical protein [Rhizobium]MCS0462387.1 hypothetical protein [Rhizobium favelukesii]UFS85036.1 hypothetical protein LPB79_31945 [Rhizobium sp. T136]CDM60069.1 hypothetical protein LPU83_pLPU83b_0069 [Rhizobium favelukesii]
MISDLLRIALAAISHNRSQDSWLAGSIVLSQFIQRVPNDIDIHHVNFSAFADAVDKDRRSLAEAGFLIASQQSSGAELEIVFFGLEGLLAVNWVVVHERPKAIIEDPHLGSRATFSDVIAQKIEMYRESLHSKHRDDLLALLEHSASMAAEISPEKLVADLSALGLRDVHQHTQSFPKTHRPRNM